MERLSANTALLVKFTGGLNGIEVPVFLQRRQELYGESFVVSVPAQPAVLPERAQDKDVDEVERLFNDFVHGIALDVNSIFVGVFVHTYEF